LIFIFTCEQVKQSNENIFLKLCKNFPLTLVLMLPFKIGDGLLLDLFFGKLKLSQIKLTFSHLGHYFNL